MKRILNKGKIMLDFYANMFYNGDIPKAHGHYLLAKLQRIGIFSPDIAIRKSAILAGLKNLLEQDRISDIEYLKLVRILEQ